MQLHGDSRDLNAVSRSLRVVKSDRHPRGAFEAFEAREAFEDFEALEAFVFVGAGRSRLGGSRDARRVGLGTRFTVRFVGRSR